MSTDTSLSVFTINGVDVSGLSSIDVSYGTTSISVTATPTDLSANVSEISGTSGLITGNNTVSFTVIAADGITTLPYSIVVRVLNNDTSLLVFTVAGQSAENGGSYSVDYGTSSVILVATTTDSSANVVDISGTSGLITGDNTVSFAVMAEDGSVQSYSINVRVLNNVTSLSTFTINGVDVSGLSRFDVSYGTPSVDVSAIPIDINANVSSISGDSGLVTGDNIVNVVVTAEDGTVQEYSINVRVLNNNASLSTFAINGVDVSSASRFDVSYGTLAVDISAIPIDINANVSSITGASGLITGDNTVSFAVTAEDGTVQEYSINVRVLNNNSALSTFTINGVDVSSASRFDVSYGTLAVDVSAIPVDINANVSSITGASGLITGDNTVSFVVMAEDGSEQSYSINVRVLNNVTTLSSFTINGVDVSELSRIDVSYGTSSVVLVATTTDSSANVVDISGTSGLMTGNNAVSFTVMAEDGSAQSYSINVHVLNNDITLSTFTINGVDVSELSRFDVSFGTSSVVLVTTTTDSSANVVDISGTSGLMTGDNTVSFAVMAEDGSVQSYSINVHVLNNVTTLSSFTINGVDVSELSRFDVSFGTSSVVLVATTTDSSANVVDISGTSGLMTGDNIVSFAVMAEDGSAQSYSINVHVLNNDTTLSTFTINGVDVSELSRFDVSFGTSSVVLVTTTTDSSANVVDISGTSGLQLGNNTVSFKVMAEDGSEQSYSINVRVLNNDTSLSTFTIAGQSAVNLGTYLVDYGTTGISVIATPTDSNAQVLDMSGTSGLITGNNSLTFKVVAEDGTVQEYYDNVRVMNNVTSLSTFTIDGRAATKGGRIDVSHNVTSVSLVATPTDTNASVIDISGITGLQLGNNTVTFKVTAEDSIIVEEYSVTVRVLNNDTSLTTFTIAGQSAVNLGTYLVNYGTTSIPVIATPTDLSAQVLDISGTSGLITGNNSLTFKVVAEDGTVQEYYDNIRVMNNVTSLSTFTINGRAATKGGRIDVSHNVTSVSLVATPTDTNASVIDISGITGLQVGNNTVTFKVTAEDSIIVEEYSVTVRVLNNDTSLSTFTINGSAVVDGQTFNVDNGTSSVTVVATKNDPNATLSSILGTTGLHTGDNPVTFSVTAEDGSIRNYSVIVDVADEHNTELSTFTVAGYNAVRDGSYNVVYGTTRVNVVAVPRSIYSTISSISGDTGLHAGSNTVSFVVTAQDGYRDTYSVTVNVVNPIVASDVLSTFTIDDTNVLNLNSVRVIFTQYTVRVVAIPIKESSIISISGDRNLKTGYNPVEVTVDMMPNGPAYKIMRNVTVSSPCLLKGTKVKTPNGYVPIEQMKVGYPLITHDGSITKVTKVGKWDCDSCNEYDKIDRSKLMYKVPAGEYKCTSPLYISHFHRMFTSDEWLRFPKNLGFKVANVSELSTSDDGKYTIYNLAVENGKHLVVNGECVVESWTSESNPQ